MRVDWVKAYSRKQRWEEETELVVEEMRRVVMFFDWKANWWSQKLDSRTGATEQVRGGLDAYCHKQSLMWKTMAILSAQLWVGPLRAYNIDCPWLDKYNGGESGEETPSLANIPTPALSTLEPQELD